MTLALEGTANAMAENADDVTEPDEIQFDDFPDGFTSGATVLVACANESAQYAIGLRALCQYGTADDTALVVTTTESADQTIDTYECVCPTSDRPALGIVDTVSEGQSLSAPYSETSVIFTPGARDIERLVVALSELSGPTPPASGNRHLLVRSLTPILDVAATDRVCTVLDRITGLRSGTGLCLLGLDYTAHDEATMAALSQQVDGVLWVTSAARDRLEFEYRPTRGRYSSSVPGGENDD